MSLSPQGNGPGKIGTSGIADGAVTNAKVNASAAIDQSKLSLAITNSEVAAGAAIAYSKLNLTGAIVNDDLAGSIAQSKITNLTTDLAAKFSPSNRQTNIVNSEIDASAAIDQSKLSLAITNSEVAAGAAIAYSKLSLSNSIVNADINSSAAIAKSKVSSTGAWTAAEIPNLAASKITSGTFDAARIPTLAQSKITNLETDLSNKQDTSEKAQANGYASLDSGGDVPLGQLGNAPSATVSTQSDSLTSDETTSSTSYVSTALSITLANRSGGKAMITATTTLSNSTENEGVFITLFDDGTTIGDDKFAAPAVANQRINIVNSHVMDLNGSVIDIRIKVNGGTGKIWGLASGDTNSNMEVLEIS